jgi:hypothetical protein
MMDPEVTFRVVGLRDGMTGPTAATKDLAMLATKGMDRSQRLGIEQTEWVDNFGKPKLVRTVLIDAESKPLDWEMGGA